MLVRVLRVSLLLRLERPLSLVLQLHTRTMYTSREPIPRRLLLSLPLPLLLVVLVQQLREPLLRRRRKQPAIRLRVKRPVVRLVLVHRLVEPRSGMRLERLVPVAVM